MNSPHLNRRHFLAALAASVVTAGAALPIGFPKEVVQPNMIAAQKWVQMQVEVRFADEASEARAREKMPWLFVYTGDANLKFEARHAA